MLAALWGYDGWDNLSFVAGEVKDPNRNIPIAIIGSVLLVIVLYVFRECRIFLCARPDGDRFGFEGLVSGKGCRQQILWRRRREPSRPAWLWRYLPLD